ncbi:hypothetical protein KR222_009058 [Zaprionus bogoriensis]|nr:hypothetical protein KR222_009058 [Zaprionus bogoriensis]
MQHSAGAGSGSEERITSSPRSSSHKSGHSLFGLLSKRPSKVEPHPVTPESPSLQRRPVSALGQYDVSFAKCTAQEAQANNNHKSQTLPQSLEKSHSGLISFHRRGQAAAKDKMHTHRYSADAGSQSDGGADVVMRRKSPKQRSPNHNRFSHQFSLCCKAEKKPLTPPVTVRYNSIPDAVLNAGNVLRRDNLSLSWSMMDNNNMGSGSQHSSEGGASYQRRPRPSSECASAPESPVASKSFFGHYEPSVAGSMHHSQHSHCSPSTSSVKSEQVHRTPIRPIAVSACRSRLRLKLYPPGQELPPLAADESDAETLKRATTPQHMSSPNIAMQPADAIDAALHEPPGVRFMSHENMTLHRQGSGSNLARQALMAAQALNLIPADKARERSYLDGRLGSSSLLGPSELSRVLPQKEVTIFVGTWNMNGHSPPKQMNDFVLPPNVEHVPDLVVVGTQESSPDRFEWEVTLQETLGPSHVLFHSTTLGTLHLAVYMRRDLIWYCSAPEDASMSVRTGSAFRTKGAVAISFCLFGTSMLFVTSHLTAHQQKVKERVSDVKRIINALDLPKNLPNLRHKNKDVTQNFDNVFWCGDLNFRLGEPREKLLEWIQNTKFPLPSHLPHGYMHTDQLSSVLADGAAFRGFMEANITFPPTYKYDPGSQNFDTSSKQRAPAYTDRILYKYRQMQGLVIRRQSTVPGVSTPTQPYVQCLLYDSVPSITTSDHKPVWALFRTLIRAGSDAIPLAAGLFNRDIYLEGMRRRLNNQYTGASAVCAIQ